LEGNTIFVIFRNCHQEISTIPA